VPRLLELQQPAFSAPAPIGPDSPIVATSPTLAWNSVSGSEGYKVYVATDPAFAHIVYSHATDATTLQVTGLSRHTVYYWRVQAYGGGLNGAMSLPMSFSLWPTPPR
jgi:hypothetical protein